MLISIRNAQTNALIHAGAPVWMIDIRISQGDGKPKRRIRSSEFRSRDEAERAVAAVRAHNQANKYGFAPLKDKPKLQRLIALRLPTIASPHEKSRSRRVLYCWLRLLDPMVHLDGDFQPVKGYVSPVTVESLRNALDRARRRTTTESGGPSLPAVTLPR